MNNKETIESLYFEEKKTKDITKEQDKGSYRIIEVNTVPGIHMHMRPSIGKPQNVAKYMVDMIFPETKEQENGKS